VVRRFLRSPGISNNSATMLNMTISEINHRTSCASLCPSSGWWETAYVIMSPM
jgi:hypothetical protein